MAEGVVKWFSESKGYGFIQQQDGTDIFVHRTGIEGGAVLQEGQKVTFEVTQTPKGASAINVVPGEMDPNYVPRRREGGFGGGRGGGGRGWGGGGGRGGGRDDRYGRDRGGNRRF